MLQGSKICPLLATLLLALAFPAGAQPEAGDNPQVVVSVYDDAGVSLGVLVQAEQEAAKIFNRAGVNVVWKNCSSSTNRVGPGALVRAEEQSSPGSASERNAVLRPAGQEGAPAPAGSSVENLDCARFAWPTHLSVRVVPQSRRSANDIFGVAFLSFEGTGCYSDVFYDRTTELQAAWNVGLADILGNVIAHELGHLLLGSNSHASMGIMKARWQAEELHRAVRGNLLFTPEQSEQMRSKLKVRPLLAVTAQAND